MVLGFRKRHEMEDITPDISSSSTSLDREAMTAEVLNSLKQFERMHHLDPNLPIDELNQVDIALSAGNIEKGIEIEQVLVEENSPYPEVGQTER